jgi:hypothetical protein
MDKKDNDNKISERDENPSIVFEEAIKRLLETPPAKKPKLPKKDK